MNNEESSHRQALLELLDGAREDLTSTQLKIDKIKQALRSPSPEAAELASKEAKIKEELSALCVTFSEPLGKYYMKGEYEEFYATASTKLGSTYHSYYVDLWQLADNIVRNRLELRYYEKELSAMRLVNDKAVAHYRDTMETHERLVKELDYTKKQGRRLAEAQQAQLQELLK